MLAFPTADRLPLPCLKWLTVLSSAHPSLLEGITLFQMLSIRNLNKETAMPLLASAHQVLVTAGPLSPTAHLHSFQPHRTASFPFLSSEPKAKPRPCHSLSCSPLPSLGPQRPSPSPVGSPNPLHFLLDGSLSLCSHLGILPPDFPDRWRHLLAVSEEADSRLSGIPYHLIQAIMASEDRRFFYHSGVDPHGIARAVFNFPKGGGGSTITQQVHDSFYP